MAHSAALSRSLVFAAAALIGTWVGRDSAERLAEFARTAWQVGSPGAGDASAHLTLAGDVLANLLGWPLVLLAAVTILAGVLQVGPILAPSKIRPRLDHLDPGQGLKRIISARAFAHLGLATLTAGVMAWLTADLLLDAAPTLSRTPGQPLSLQADLGAELLARLAWRAAVVLLLFGVLDALVARRAHQRQLRMTREEVRREQREQEGDPEIQGQRREIQRELSGRDALAAAGRADVLVQSDDGRVVALRYAPPDDPAPFILCTAAGDEARRVLAAAARADIPRVRAAPLAAELCRVGENQWLPEELYGPMAEIYRGIRGIRGRT